MQDKAKTKAQLIAELTDLRRQIETDVEQQTAKLKKANEQLAALYKVGQTITAPLQLDVVLDTIARSTAELLGTDTGVILLLDEATQTLSIKGSYGLSERVVKGTRDHVGESIAGRVVQTGQPIIANDLPNNPHFYNPSAKKEGLLACASVPLVVGQRIIGTLDVHSKAKCDAFDEDHIQILNMLASQAAIAIDNARLYEELQQAHDKLEMRVKKRTAKLAATNQQLQQEIVERKQAEEAVKRLAEQRKQLFQASQSILSTLALDEVVHRILQALRKVLRYDICELYWLDEEDGVLRPFVRVGTEHVPKNLDAWTIPLGQGIASAVIELGKGELVNNAHRDPRSFYPEGVQIEYEHLISIPLKTQEKTLGVFDVSRKTDPPFTEEEFELVQLFIAQATTAIYSAQLYTEVKQQAVELSTMLETSKAISSTLDLKEVLKLIAEQMATVIGVTGCTLSRWDQAANTVVTWVDWRRKWSDPVDKPGGAYILDDFPTTRIVLEQRQPMTVLVTDPNADPTEVTLMKQMDVASLLMLPLVVGERVIGLVELDEEEYDRVFTPTEIRLCQALASQAAVAIDNAQFYTETQRRLKEQTALREASTVISSTLDLQTVLSRIAEQMSRAIDLTSAYICSFEPEKGTSTVLAEYISPQACVPEQISDLGATYNETDDQRFLKAMLNGQFWLDHLNDPNLPEEDRHAMEQYGAQSILHIPLSTRGQTIGYAELWESRRRREFTAEEIVLCQSITQQAAIAIENAQLYAEAQQHLKEQTILREAVTVISSTLDLKAVLSHITEQMGQIVDATSTYICSFDQEAKTTSVLAEYFSPEANALERVSDLGVTYVEDNAKFLQALLTGQYLAEHVDDPNLAASDQAHMQQYGTRTALYIPLQIRDQTIAFAELWESRRRREFTAEEIALCQDIAQQAAIAIENARLFEQAQQEIAERKQAEATKAKLEEQLRQAQKMEAIGTLAGGIAHDFNNMLTAIMGYTDLSLTALSPDTQIYEDIQGIQRIAQRAADLTSQLLAFARRQMIQPSVLNLNDLIFDMGKMLRRLIGVNIELVILPAPDLGQVKADPNQIEQVLINLVVNARDAILENGKLIIETANITLDQAYAQQYAEVIPGEYVMLSVSDNGVGMSAEVKTHIFEPFFTTKEVGQGTGLGLATCFGIVKQNDGHIEVYSEVGHGTTVKVYLPYLKEAAGFATKRDVSVKLPSGRETILLVEDDPSVRYLSVRTLRHRGYTVFEAANGSEALHMVNEQVEKEIALLVTDMVMPQMGGKRLADQIKTKHPDIKILFISGYTDRVLADILEPGAAFLQKPFPPDALVRKVREVLDDQ